MGRKVRDAREAQACLESVAASGQTRAEWARRNGVDARSLNAWRLNLVRQGHVEVPRLVELVATSPPGTNGCRIVYRDVLVEVDPDFDAGTLRRVLSLLGAY